MSEAKKSKLIRELLSDKLKAREFLEYICKEREEMIDGERKVNDYSLVKIGSKYYKPKQL